MAATVGTGGTALQTCMLCRRGALQAGWPHVHSPLTRPSALRRHLQGATPIACKRWSYRAKDGVCRLFGPASSTQRSVALTAQTAKDQEWASGTGGLSMSTAVVIGTIFPGNTHPATAAPLAL